MAVLLLFPNSSNSSSTFLRLIITSFVVLLFKSFVVYSLPDEPQLTYSTLYQAGKGAYTEERWFECVAFMRRAIEDYQFYRSISWNCHQRCERHIPTVLFPFDTPAFREDKRAAFDQSIPEVRIFERFVKNALCLRRCKHDRLPTRPHERVDEKVENELRQLKPYSYMQLCYWKLSDLEHAVSAAYTFLVKNPADKMMLENLQYYMNEKSYKEEMIKDLEQNEFQTAYMNGIDAYDQKRYMDVIDKMERSLENYIEEYEKCRALCDEPAINHEQIQATSDFYSTITTFYVQVLKCREECHGGLSNIRGNRLEDFVPSHFHYLQFAYYKESMVRKTAESVATYLLFYPEDETMLNNKRYYLENFDLKLEHFVPRTIIVRHYKRLLLEKRLLAFLSEKFQFDDDDQYPRYHPDDYRDIPDDIPGMDDHEYANMQKPKDEKTKKPVLEEEEEEGFSLPPAPAHKRKRSDHFAPTIPNMEVMSPFWTPSNDVLTKYHIKHGVEVVKKETDLSGRYRFLADKLLSKEECDQLLELAKLAELGDGYNGLASPHTKHEEFSGLTVTRVAELAAQGKVPLDSAKLLLDKSELGRDLVQTYFNLTTYLYFDYTHLVCRSAKEDGEIEAPSLLRSDLSHAIHGDNCVFLKGRCDKKFPAYTWRDYSAVIYLNDDFTGGEFIFSDQNKDVQAEVTPKCGQMVAFSGDTLHGVKAVTSGRRCVIALWLTLDPSHEELERIRAQQILAKLDLTSDVDQKLSKLAKSASPLGESYCTRLPKKEEGK